MRYIIVDSREKPKAIKGILKHFEDEGIQYESSKLLFGDYMDWNRPGLVIDRKQNIQELAKNCTVEHERFKREMERAKKAACDFVWASSPDFEEDQAEIYAECDRYKEAIESCSNQFEWISATERLPKIYSQVLVTRKASIADFILIDLAYFNRCDSIWETDEISDVEVLAWMPLPDPYEGLNERSE